MNELVQSLLKIVLGTLVGTSLMTAFSYLISEQFRKKFQEPRLLQYVMKLCHLKLSDYKLDMAAWLIHYALGLLFVVTYHLLWLYLVPITWGSALVFGGLSGVIGILGWLLIFSLPSKRPKVAFGSYYLQLFFAHVVFAQGVFFVYKVFEYLFR